MQKSVYSISVGRSYMINQRIALAVLHIIVLPGLKRGITHWILEKLNKLRTTTPNYFEIHA